MNRQSLGQYINGQWVTSQGVIFHSINPANGKKLWQGSEASLTEVKLAYAGARDASYGWSALPQTARESILQRFVGQIGHHRKALIEQISLETGKPRWEAAVEVHSVISKINLSIQAYEERCPEREVKHADHSRHALRYKPHGVVVVLGPFNFPAHLSNGHIVPALLAGNTVIYKPSELTPGVAELIMQCWHESGLPAGALQCLQGSATVAKRLFAEDIDGLFFTGSYRTGQLINQFFSDRPEVLLALEMGGNNPLIIDELADIPTAVYNTILSTMITAGQRCTCARRLMVPDSVFGDEFINQYLKACRSLRVGEYTETPEPFMGPVIRPQHAQMHLSKQEELINAEGKPLLRMTLLKPDSGFLSPGVIDMTQVNHQTDEEIFAPFVQVFRYHHFEDAITLANRTRYGLAAALFSDNAEHYQQFYQHIKAGLINWNKPTTGASSGLPFGGIGQSGNHRPSAYFAADYCAYPIASMEQSELAMPEVKLPGIDVATT